MHGIRVKAAGCSAPELVNAQRPNFLGGGATPKVFYDFFVAYTPDPATGKPDREKIAAFNESNVEGQLLEELLANSTAPSNYSSNDFYSVHTFKFINREEKETLVRWHFSPQHDNERVGKEKNKVAFTPSLDQDIIARARAGPIRWDMIVTIGESTDEQINPTVYWPKDRKQIKAGVLTLTSASPQEGGTCEKINFDPLVMAPGIGPTNDPVLLFRSPSYSVSYEKHINGK